MRDPQHVDDVLREVKRLANVPRRTVAEARAAGRDAAINGSNTQNTHFSYFASKRLSNAWMEAHDAAKADGRNEA